MNKLNVSSSDKSRKIVSRLYKIRNIANLAVLCPQGDTEVYILQDIFEHISETVQNLIEELEQDF